MTTENIVITIREDGSREVARNIRDIGTQSTSSQRSVNALKSALASLAGALALGQLREYSDIWTQVQGKVNIFTHSANETASVMEQLYKIAQDTRQPLQAVGDSFHQMSIAGATLGASQQELLTVTEAIGKAFAIQGTSANTARGGIIQFGQAMNEGIVRAQEYNSMINAMPLVLKAVAMNIDGVDGSLAKLRKRMLDGKLYSKDFFKALQDGEPYLTEMFERSGKTIGQAFTIMENALIRYVGHLNESTGFTKTFYDAAKFLADNIEDVANGLIIVASPFILQGLLAVGNALRLMAIYAAANPYVALAAAITMAATALTLYRHEIILVEEGQVSFGDYAKAAWQMAGEGASELATWIGTNVPAALAKATGNITGFQIAWTDVDSVLRTIINGWIGYFVSLPKMFIAVWKVVPDALYNIFATAFNGVKGLVSNNMNTIIGILNPLLEKVNIAGITEVQFEETKPRIVKSWQELDTELSDILKNGVSTNYIGMVEEGLDALGKRAAALAKARHAEDAARTQDFDLTGAMGPGEDYAGNAKGAGKVTNELLRLEKQLASVVSAASPAEGALLKLQAAESVLDKSLQKGLLTREEYNKYLALTKQHYAEVANPMGELIKKIDDEAAALKLNSTAREVETKALEARRALMEKGAYVDEKDLQMLRDRYAGLQKLSEAINAQDKLLANSIETRKAFAVQLKAIRDLMDDPTSGFSGADAQEALYQMNPQLFEGTSQYVDHVRQSYQDMFTQIDQMRQADLISEQQSNQMRIANLEALKQAVIAAEVQAANVRLSLSQGDWADVMISSAGRVLEGFTSMQAGIASSFGDLFVNLSDGFANAFSRAIVYGEDLGDMLRNVAAQAVQQLIASLIKLGIQWAIQAALASTLGAATTAGSVAMAATTAAAWAPAAALASLATLGANAGPATIGMSSTIVAAKSFALLGMAHDGMDYIPKEGTWLLDEGERVVDKRTNADLKDYLSRAANGSYYNGDGEQVTSAAPQVTVTIINNAEGTSISKTQSQDENGNQDIRVQIDNIENALAARLDSGQGTLSTSIQKNYGVAHQTLKR